jgi:Mg/Co/Ni transporter MgtE
MPKNNYNPDKIIHEISYYPKKRLDVFKSLSVNQKAEIILLLSKHLQYDIVSKLNKQEIIGLLEHLDADEATDILQLIPEKKRHPIISELKRAEEIKYILAFAI